MGDQKDFNKRKSQNKRRGWFFFFKKRKGSGDDLTFLVRGGEWGDPQQSGRLRTPAVRPGDITGNHLLFANCKDSSQNHNFIFIEDGTSE